MFPATTIINGKTRTLFGNLIARAEKMIDTNEEFRQRARVGHESHARATKGRRMSIQAAVEKNRLAGHASRWKARAAKSHPVEDPAKGAVAAASEAVTGQAKWLKYEVDKVTARDVLVLSWDDPRAFAQKIRTRGRSLTRGRGSPSRSKRVPVPSLPTKSFSAPS